MNLRFWISRFWVPRFWPCRFWTVALGIFILTVSQGFGSEKFSFEFLSFNPSGQAAHAQPAVILRRVDPVAIATEVYAQYPDLPQENHYTRQGSNEVATQDSLVSRFIRYHLYVKDRPGNFRLDWKLSIADYLGAYDSINPENYPSARALSTNPANGDQLAIQQLSRVERNRLVQSIFGIFIGQTPDISPSGTNNTVEESSTPSSVEPSAADLLLF